MTVLTICVQNLHRCSGNQLAKGNNGLVRTKYLTFGIEADNIREAKPKLERIETDILNNFKILGVSAYPVEWCGAFTDYV